MATKFKSVSSFFYEVSLLSLLFSTNQTISQPDHMSTFCNQFSDNFTRTSSYRTNREALLSSLRDRSSLRTYSNDTSGISPDTVRGMFLCRGDISLTSCSDCVQTATLEIATNCTYQKEAWIFYEECMVRYSDFSFFTLVEDRPYTIRYSLSSPPNADLFGQTLSNKMDELIIKVSSSLSSSTPYFVEDQERVTTESEGSYDLDSLAQCSPDLDPRNCTVCLRLASQAILDCCNRSRRAQIFTPKCLFRYEASSLTSPPSARTPSPPLLIPSPRTPSPPLFLPSPQTPSPPLFLPSPPLFTRPQNVPSLSRSFATKVINGNDIMGRIFIAVMTAVLVCGCKY